MHSHGGRPCCSVGARSDVGAIDEALRAGGSDNSIRKVAARVGVAPAAIQRHRDHLLGRPVVLAASSDTPAPVTDAASDAAPEAGRTAPMQVIGGGQPATPPRDVIRSRARIKPLKNLLPSEPVEAPTARADTPPDTSPDVSGGPGDEVAPVGPVHIPVGGRADERVDIKKRESPPGESVQMSAPAQQVEQGAPSTHQAEAPPLPSPPTREPSRSKPTPADADPNDDVPPFPPRPGDRIGRVEAIENMMLELSWEKGKTGPRLAAAWGLSLAAIENYSNEAWRNIKRNIDPSSVRDRLGSALWKAVRQASDSGDPKAVATVAKSYAELVGLIAGGKTLQVEVVVREPWFQEMLGVLLGSIQHRAPEILPGVREDLQEFLSTRNRPELRALPSGKAA